MGIEGANCSEDLAHTIGHITAATNSFEECREVIEEAGLVNISTTFIQKIANKVGRAGIKEEEELMGKTHKEVKQMGIDAKGSQVFGVFMDGGRCQTLENGKPVWKEVKMGGFCQYDKVWNEDKQKKQPVKIDCDFIGRVDEGINIFGERLYLEAIKNGYEKGEVKVFIGDGAAYNWDIHAHYFCDAIPILDYYHATEHLAKAGRAICLNDQRFKQWNEKFKEHLFNGQIQTIIQELEKHIKKKKISKDKKKELKTEITYFNNNRERMYYKKYEEMSLPIGSGVIESGIKQLVNKRIKGTEKHWLKKHANNILKLRIEKIFGDLRNLCCFNMLYA